MTASDFARIGATTLAFASTPVAAQDAARVLAAGSLRAVMNELGLAFTSDAAARPRFEFGASGLLRDRLIAGERADVFASANLEHPRALVAAGLSRTTITFARNRMCALAAPNVKTDSAGLLDALLDPAYRLGTSTPRADPSGDYAWEVFDKAEAIRPGAREVLAGKARKLTGGPSSPPPPAGRSLYAALVESGEADLFLTYCTNVASARKENPSLQRIELPEALAVGADYGITVLNGAPASADAFVRFVLSPEGQRILASHGFDTSRTQR
jgi:ABC-type molybdate transport system substrate-binding protein